MNEFMNYKKYEAFNEEPLDSTIFPDTVEEVESMPLYKLGEWKIIYIKAEDFQNTFYL
jgi:ribosomal protein S17